MLPSSNTHLRARIVERRDISSDLWTIRVDAGTDFHFEAGQYATLGLAGPTGYCERPYSIVSSPDEKLLEFFIEFVPDGEFTPLLHGCREGDEITLRKNAKGVLKLDYSCAQKNLLLLATVTGVSPFVSHIRAARRQSELGKSPLAHKLWLMEGASRSWELGYREELQKTADEVPWLTYVPTISRPAEDRSWSGEIGRVDDLVRKHTDLWNLTPDNTLAYLCGHPGMIENALGILQRRGWAAHDIKSETFFMPESKNAAHALATM